MFIKNIESFWTLFAIAYCIGGVANHAIMLAIHEISHGMGFGTAKPLANKLFSIFANLPIGIPMSISFKKYHLEHHRYQGDELLDTDIPTFAEVAFFKTSLRKTIWCILQPFFYTMRPLFVNPKPLEAMELVNIAVQLVFDVFVVAFLGWHVLAYMIGGTILAMGLHPVAGHFISEHTIMFDSENNKHTRESSNNSINADANGLPACDLNNNDFSDDSVKATGDIKLNGATNGNLGMTVDQKGQFLVPETCSYYGPLNMLTFNVGYHVEHHDFPSIPGSRLHMLSKIAPEFYTSLKHHTSWTYVLWQYITDPKVGPSARVRRPHSHIKEKLF